MIRIVAIAALALGLTACAQAAPEPEPISTPVIAPVTISANDLQGSSVDLVPGQSLNIDTGDLEVTSYRGEVADTEIAQFVPGREDDSATFNPGVVALAVGSTEVRMSNTDGGIQDLVFTVQVVAAE